jgi:hypothetical protein
MDGLLVLAVLVAGGFGWWFSSLYHKRRGPRPAKPEPHFLDEPTNVVRIQPGKAKWAVSNNRSGFSNASLPTAAPLDIDAKRERIRDRYLAVRFDGLIRDARDLKDIAKVIKAARLYFEDENSDRADELLRLAVAAQPHEARLWLARLEIQFLSRDAERFSEVAQAYRRAFPDGGEWPQVACLGRALSPGDACFRDSTAGHDDENYGPWPNTPNWIEASWDLTAEVAGADFHRHMRARIDRRRAVGAGASR